MYLDTMRAKDIVQYLDQEDCIIIDLRSKEEYQRGHIKTSVNIPFEDLDEYTLEWDGYNTIIVYCERGNLSLMAAREIKKNVQTQRVISIVGGYLAYRQYFNE